MRTTDDAVGIPVGSDLLRATGHAEPGGPWVPVRAGVHTGHMWFGTVGDGSHIEITVLGDVVNTCARLVSAHCAPGEILLTAATGDRLGATAGLRPMGAVAVRGRAAPVGVFAFEPPRDQNE